MIDGEEAHDVVVRGDQRRCIGSQRVPHDGNREAECHRAGAEVEEQTLITPGVRCSCMFGEPFAQNSGK